MVLDLNYEILLDEFESKFKSDRSELDKIDQEISKNNQRLQNAQHLLLDAELSARDYKDIKFKIEGSNEELIRKKENLSSGQEDFREHLKHGATILRNIDKFYEKATLSEKQLIIGSVFPEKLIFEKDHFRTKRMNEAVALMCMNHNDLAQKKSGRAKNFLATSAQVALTGQFSNSGRALPDVAQCTSSYEMRSLRNRKARLRMKHASAGAGALTGQFSNLFIEDLKRLAGLAA